MTSIQAVSIRAPSGGLRRKRLRDRRGRCQLDWPRAGRVLPLARAGQDPGIDHVCSFDTRGIGREYAGEVKGFRAKDHLTPAEIRRTGRCSAMALAAARMALTGRGPRTLHDLRGPRSAVVDRDDDGRRRRPDGSRPCAHQGRSRRSEALDAPEVYGATLLSPIHVARGLGAEGNGSSSLPAACAAGNYAHWLRGWISASARGARTSS